MKKILLLFSLWFWPLAAEVFFVPGWRTGFDGRAGCVRILHDAYPGEKITVKSWDSDQPWEICKHNAAEHKEKLLEEIIAMPEENRRELIMVGHSIGAGIVLEILADLNRRGLRVHSAALLGAAVPDDLKDIRKALQALRYHCCIIYNPDDWVLRYLLPMDDAEHIPWGVYGWTESSPRVFEARAASDRWGFFNHFAYIYLEELDRLLDRLPPVAERIAVLQDDENTVRRPADELFWQTEAEYQSWQLQKRVFPWGAEKYRIIDPEGLRRAAGNPEKMRSAFDDVVRQLSAGTGK